jgi:flagellar biogenesis protein FliO
MDSLWRLTWALPIVLTVGAAIVLVLRRLVVPTSSADAPQKRLSVCESMPLSAATRVHLIEVDGSACVVLESEQRATLHSLPSLQAGDGARAPGSLRARWAQRFRKSQRR